MQIGLADVMLDRPGLSTPAVVENSFVPSGLGDMRMRVSVLLQITSDDGVTAPAKEIATFK